MCVCVFDVHTHTMIHSGFIYKHEKMFSAHDLCRFVTTSNNQNFHRNKLKLKKIIGFHMSLFNCRESFRLILT